MHTSSKQVIAFNLKGDKAWSTSVPSNLYLTTEKEWIETTLGRNLDADGIALLIDWETREITQVKYAEIY